MVAQYGSYLGTMKNRAASTDPEPSLVCETDRAEKIDPVARPGGEKEKEKEREREREREIERERERER